MLPHYWYIHTETLMIMSLDLVQKLNIKSSAVSCGMSFIHSAVCVNIMPFAEKSIEFLSYEWKREDSLCHYICGTVLWTLDLYVGCISIYPRRHRPTDHWVTGIAWGQVMKDWSVLLTTCDVFISLCCHSV